MTAPAHPPAPERACPNCGHRFGTDLALPRHCPDCGQETHLHAPTLLEFVHEFITHYIALEGALWRSLRVLLFRPGQLTLDYLAGRRRQHVLPLRLYLTASFLFFLSLKLSGLPATSTVTFGTSPPAAAGAPAASSATPPTRAAAAPPAATRPSASGVAPAAPAASDDRAPATADCGAPGPDCGWLDRWATRIEQRLESRLDAPGQPERNASMVAKMLAWAPYVVFLMLPLFAGLTRLAYWRRPLAYGAHVVFSLHLHTVWCLAAWLNLVLPAGLGGLALLTMPVYGVLSMHRVFGGGWGAALLRAFLITVVYGGLLVLGTLLTTLASALST